MRWKKDIQFIIIFVFIVTVSLLYLSRTSYAKYRKQAQANTAATIASWNIKVNNETINNKAVLSNFIIPTFDTNQYVKTGFLAPGSTGYFDVVIDATDVDVDFTYEIAGSVHEDTPLADLVLTQYVVNNVTYTYDSVNHITGDILKNSSNNSIRIYFQWNDSTGQTMSNQQDTQYATNANYQQTKIKLEITFNQKQ